MIFCLENIKKNKYFNSKMILYYRTKSIDERIGTPHSKSPPAASCKTLRQQPQDHHVEVSRPKVVAVRHTCFISCFHIDCNVQQL